MRVPSKDYGRQYQALWPELLPALESAFVEGQPVLGPAVERFEAAFASYHGVESCVGVGSGTDAIILALRALGLGAGDEVVTGAHTFSGVISAMLQAGVRPVLADPGPSGLLDAASVEQAMSNNTRAVLGVHLYGHPIELSELVDLCEQRNLHFIEDAAQAHGARYDGRPVGSFGRVAVTSFHPSKNLGAFGDGGAILTDDPALAAVTRELRNLGKRGKYEIAHVAPNTKLDSLQAVLLGVKLPYLDSWVDRRRSLAERYRQHLFGIEGLSLPSEAPGVRHAYHLYVARTGRRDELHAYLTKRGVKSGLHYPIAAHQQPGLVARLGDLRLPQAEELARTVITLPLSHELTDAEVDHAAALVHEFYAQ
jgi:dTDP-4-amino-4,6-dideoxygalactose transaminase